MKHFRTTLVFFLSPLLTVLVACSTPAMKAAAGVEGASPTGRLTGPFPVVKVVDGDTVTLLLPTGSESIRLIGIDTPEKYAGRKLTADARKSGRPQEELMALGRQASKVTAGLVAGEALWLELDVQERDRYGRLLAYLYVTDPKGDWQHEGRRLRQINLEIVRAGWAEPLTIPPNVRYQALYREAARAAKGQRIGIWAHPSRLTPSDDACEPLGKSCPEECPIKGNINRKGKKLFHRPGGQFYDRTIPEACFPNEEEAGAAGFVAAKR